MISWSLNAASLGLLRGRACTSAHGFCFVSFIANRRDAAGMPRNPGSHGLNEAALQAGWWPWTSGSQRGLGVRRQLPARRPPRTSHLHTCAKVPSAARAHRAHRAPNVRYRGLHGPAHFYQWNFSSRRACRFGLQMEASTLPHQTCEVNLKRSRIKWIHQACTNQELDAANFQATFFCIMSCFCILLPIFEWNSTPL